MDINLSEWRTWLLLYDNKYLIPIFIVLVFTLTFLYRKKNWKECAKAFLLTFLLSACIHYCFFAIVHHFPPAAKWRILSMLLVDEAVQWGYHIFINLIILRLVVEVIRLLVPIKIVSYVVFIFVSCVYLLIYILFFQAILDVPLIPFFYLIPDITY